MEQVRPLYAHVQSVVLESLRREWQRYGWEDSEIDDKVDRLSQLWNAALERAGSLPTPSQHSSSAAAQQAQAEGSEEKKAEDASSAEAKRKRKGEEESAEKRFKSGPRVDAPLTYPMLPAHSAVAPYQSSASTSSSAAANPYDTPMPPSATIPPYTPRSFHTPPLTSSSHVVPPTATAPPPPPPSSSSSSATAVRPFPQVDGSPDAAPPSAKAEPGVASSSTTPLSSSAPSSSSPSSSPSTSDESSNPLLTAPLSWLDDPDSSDDVDLTAVRDLLVCQYERVSHAKSRWKVLLRDGILNVKGKDYVFSRCSGELQW